jgi:GNAT superfamily N-acetyltransferase
MTKSTNPRRTGDAAAAAGSKVLATYQAKPTPYSIERATFDDSRGILRCLRAAFEPYEHLYTPAGYVDTVMTPETLGRRLEAMTMFVARDQAGVIIGTIGGHRQGDEGHIRGMAVIPEWQGRGVADRLLTTIEAALAAAGCSILTLDTTAPLGRAIHFYERNGYQPSGAISDFFSMPLYEYAKRLTR